MTELDRMNGDISKQFWVRVAAEIKNLVASSIKDATGRRYTSGYTDSGFIVEVTGPDQEGGKAIEMTVRINIEGED